MEDKIKDIFEDEEKAEKLSKIIKDEVDRRVEERIDDRNDDSNKETEDISRRSFLKKLGAGAAGLGMASLIPGASAYDIRSSDGLEVFDSNGKYFDVNPGGPVEINNTSLTLNSNRIGSVDQIDFDEDTKQKAQWYSTTYSTGVESSTLYWESNNRFRWYADNVGADGGTSNHMQLDANNLWLESVNLNMNANNITDVRSTGNTVVVSGSQFEVQVDGTDGSGIINLKTSS